MMMSCFGGFALCLNPGLVAEFLSCLAKNHIMHHAFKHDCDSLSPNLWQPTFLPLPAIGQRHVEKFYVWDHRMLDFYTAVYTATNCQVVCKTLDYQLCIYRAWSDFRAKKILRLANRGISWKHTHSASLSIRFSVFI